MVTSLSPTSWKSVLPADEQGSGSYHPLSPIPAGRHAKQPPAALLVVRSISMMGGPVAALLAAVSVAAYSILFSGPLDVAILAFFPVVWHRHVFVDVLDSAPLQHAARVTTGVVLGFLFFQILRMRRATSGTGHWNGPGKLLFFPCRTSHSRMFPRRHSFSYPYLMVGVPVGFEGNAGGMVSVGVRGKQGLFSWLSLAPRALDAWFTIDASDYLERGKSELGLRGKLDEYLRSQVSAAPGFVGQSRVLTLVLRGPNPQTIRTPIWSLLPASSATTSTRSRSGIYTMPISA